VVQAKPQTGPAQARPPHPATVVQAKPEARPLRERAPHPATTVQRRAAPAATAKPPHPATVGRSTPGDSDTAQPALERVQRGFGYKAVATGVLAGASYGLLASNPVGWIVGGLGTLASLSSAYYLGGKSEDDKDDKDDELVSDVKQKGSVVKSKGPSQEDLWKGLQQARREYEEGHESVAKELKKIRLSVVTMRTLSRKIMARQPLMDLIADVGTKSSDLDDWRGEIERATLRGAAKKGRSALTAYATFYENLEALETWEPVEHITRKKFVRYGGLESRKSEMQEDLVERGKKLKALQGEQEEVDSILEARDEEESRIRSASRSWRDPPVAIAATEEPVVNKSGTKYLDDTYPDGWVHIAGNAYAAIAKAGAKLLSEAALPLFQDALANGSIADYGTGASGVKWGKCELKVRRTRLEAIAVAGDTRLAGAINSVTTDVSKMSADIRVLELTRIIQAH
jgi:hypothetical protein